MTYLYKCVCLLIYNLKSSSIYRLYTYFLLNISIFVSCQVLPGGFQGGRGYKRVGLGVWGERMQIGIYRMDKQQSSTVVGAIIIT